MTAVSVLELSPADSATGSTSAPPPFFVDLNLDQIVASVTAGKEEYNLAPIFFRPLQTVTRSPIARPSCATSKTARLMTPCPNSPNE